jgi:hypothetical protein
MKVVAGKRGMLPLRPGKFGLSFGDLLLRSQLPQLPQRFGHIMAQPPGGFGMMGNAVASDCVCAGAIHEIMTHHIATQRPLPPFSEQGALREYSKLLVAEGGAPWDPANPKTDTGLDPQKVAQYRQDVGILDDDGVAHKVQAYALIQDLNDAMYGSYFFGAAGVGLMLPNTAEKQFNNHHVWDDMRSAPKPQNGHYVVLVDRNSAGNLVLLTWGSLHAATPAYLERYWAGAIAPLSSEYLLASGVSPEGFNTEALQNYLAAIGTG